MKILIATRNKGKLDEYRELLADVETGDQPVDWVSLTDVGITLDVPETGDTFEENALLKATTYAKKSGLLTLADDSGLEVTALDGAPGVHSARYAGSDASDRDRYRKLLRELENVPVPDREARFVCVVAICTPDGETYTAEGDVKGRIAFEPKGNYGFGYDPVFHVPGLRMTMAQLGPDVKNKISHRAVALKNIIPALETLITDE